jgi:alkanesulfonate monooxygenase SsuD/methylene tetrahydromethanopterin reductase-like flavin-dependent oxidoreductase (luciferase family)
MRFGLILVPAVKDGDPEPFDKLLEQIEWAEELGYDSVWLTEHHFSDYGRPAVPALAGAAIARTRLIRVSTAVVVLPFHDPIRVAEDWATLDHLSKGRVDFGIGRGNQPAEFAGFGIQMDESNERFEEALDIIRRAWTEKSFSHDGRFWKFPELEILPKPYTKPHPPIWQAALSDYTVRKIVERGINGLIGPYLCPSEKLKNDYFEPWHRIRAEAGRMDLDTCHNEFVYVGESDEQVKAEVAEDVMWYVRKAAKIWGERDRGKMAAQYSNYADIVEWLDQLTFEEVYEDLAILGTPDRVAEKVRWFRDECGCDYLMNFMWFGGMSHEKAMRNMELFAREVMPQFRDPAGAPEPEPQAIAT